MDSVFEGETPSVTVQQLIDHWHLQHSTHAALQCALNIVLQVGRFDFDAQSEISVHQWYQLLPDKEIRFPVSCCVQCRST